jgi:glycosyltransferase involved in cell wall biosynthesis/thiol-disulfide isomerase/thioredoxin
MTLIEVTDITYDSLATHKPALFFFYTQWCPLCPVVRSILEDLAEIHHEDIVFFQTDMEKNPALCDKCNVLGVPTAISIQGGRVTDNRTGLREAFQYKEMAENLLPSARIALNDVRDNHTESEKTMATISLCMIVKNESRHLADCLNSVVDLVDEIVIADTGSTDNTKQIAAEFTDKIYDFPWIDDFSAARNFSYSKATKDYIMWLDADDTIPPSQHEKFLALKGRLLLEDAVLMKYVTACDENGNPTFSFYRERITKRERNFKWHEAVHEYLEKSGNIIQCDIEIRHNKGEYVYSDRNLRIYEKQIAEGRALSSRGKYYYARELFYFKRYEESISMFQQFLDEKDGWVEDEISACDFMAKCYTALNREDEALKILFSAFAYDTPRGETCCSIGYIYKNRAEFKKALFWFNLASELEKPNSWGFFRREYWDYIPLIESAVCCDKLGNIKKAMEYNERAGLAKPGDPSVEQNRRYFSSIDK